MPVTRTARLLALAVILAAPAAFAAGAKGDARKGQELFTTRICSTCHAVNDAPGGPIAGPSLAGIVGRKAASVSGFALYSPALKNSGLSWNEKTLDEFLANPMGKVPGTMMVIALPDAKERADVIAYLTTLKDGKK